MLLVINMIIKICDNVHKICRKWNHWNGIQSAAEEERLFKSFGDGLEPEVDKSLDSFLDDREVRLCLA